MTPRFKPSFVVTPEAEALARQYRCTPTNLVRYAEQDMKARPTSIGNTLIWHAFGLPDRPFEFVVIPRRGEMVLDRIDWRVLSDMGEGFSNNRPRR